MYNKKEIEKIVYSYKTNDREVYMKGIDTSYKYEGNSTYTMNELDK